MGVGGTFSVRVGNKHVAYYDFKLQTVWSSLISSKT